MLPSSFKVQSVFSVFSDGFIVPLSFLFEEGIGLLERICVVISYLSRLQDLYFHLRPSRSACASFPAIIHYGPFLFSRV